MSRIDKKIEKDLKKVIKSLKNKFRDNLSALILYGSWVKGKARENSDIDLLIIFKSKRKSLMKESYSLIEKINPKKDVSLVSASIREFKKEAIPLYTAVKREGQIIYGEVDLTTNPKSPQTKYRDFFVKSGKFEKGKIETAEYLMKKGISSGISEFCYIASKHAFQAGLAIKGVGFSSKFCVLVKWIEKYFGKGLAKAFKALFELYKKSEYKMQDLTKMENLLSIRESKRILKKIYSKHNLLR